jgi:O-acetyl-ADP-ribose deacetylase (regulator of RNase III)
MMIEEGHGNLLAAEVDALVNTVNTVGVMGKGIALQFRRAYPANYSAYRDACARGEMQLGRMRFPLWAAATAASPGRTYGR